MAHALTSSVIESSTSTSTSTFDFLPWLGREAEAARLQTFLQDFERHKRDPPPAVGKMDMYKRGLYVYGPPGVGKTTWVKQVLTSLGYDVIRYDAGDIRNKSVIDTISKHSMSDKNIMSLFHRKVQRIAIVMDEIDGMNSGDKGGINSLIKLIRPKKTKKQKTEEISMNPILCIGSVHVDKKITELMKVCCCIELTPPSPQQIQRLISHGLQCEKALLEPLLPLLQGDLRKVRMLMDMVQRMSGSCPWETILRLFAKKSYHNDTKKITHALLETYLPLEEHAPLMNETDRTIVSLLWHENIVDRLASLPREEALVFYVACLDNLCFADYIDRVTFQKQIWQFNEMSSLVKTFYNNKQYHRFQEAQGKEKLPQAQAQAQEIRFTKVLTKYSTEYNNATFVQDLCQKLSMDKKDLLSFFLEYRDDEGKVTSLLDSLDVQKLDVQRMYRYIDKFTRENAPSMEDEVVVETFPSGGGDDEDGGGGGGGE